MGVIMLKCPATNRDISTGIEVEPACLDSLPDVQMSLECPVCGIVHSWRKGNSWLANYTGEPERGGDRDAAPSIVPYI